jgi:hypothetical protein
MDSEVVNLSTFKRDIYPLFNGNSRRILIETPIKNKNNNELTVKGFENLMQEVIKTANLLPYSRCVLTYKINENSNICLEIHPVTDAA